MEAFSNLNKGEAKDDVASTKTPHLNHHSEEKILESYQRTDRNASDSIWALQVVSGIKFQFILRVNEPVHVWVMELDNLQFGCRGEL